MQIYIEQNKLANNVNNMQSKPHPNNSTSSSKSNTNINATSYNQSHLNNNNNNNISSKTSTISRLNHQIQIDNNPNAMISAPIPSLTAKNITSNTKQHDIITTSINQQ